MKSKSHFVSPVPSGDLQTALPGFIPAPSADTKAALEMLYASAEYEEHDLTCETCGGSGADSWEAWNPCPDCDGEGYRWWE